MVKEQKYHVAKSEEVVYPRKTALCQAGGNEEERGRNYAALITSPEMATVRIIMEAEAKAGLAEHIDVPTLMEQLRTQASAVNENDLTQAEAMLINQATALQSLFAHLTEKALSGESLPQFETFMRMALRAQNQCRATLETLAAIKNPTVIYARQANFAHGNQQVNNGAAEPVGDVGAGNSGQPRCRQESYAREETEIKPNELLTEVTHGQTMDVGTTSAAIRINAAVEALGEVNGSKDTNG